MTKCPIPPPRMDEQTHWRLTGATPNASRYFMVRAYTSVTKCMWLMIMKFKNLGLEINKRAAPKGPRSLTWGKGQESRWSHLQRTTNVVHQILAEKYESSGPCSFRQDFWKLHFENLFLNPWPTYATNQNHFNNFGRGLPRDHSCWVCSNSHKRFKIRSHLKFSLYNSI